MRVNLTVAEANHVLTLIVDRIEDGIYYGNKEQYYARSERIRQKFSEALKAEINSRGKP